MIYRFETFELDEARFEIRRDGVKINVERKALDILFVLVRNRDRVVTRDELLRLVWPDIAVTRRIVDQAVYMARQALGDDPANPRIVATVRGRGHRWVADVVQAEISFGTTGALPPGEVPFIGRSAELKLLETAVLAARQGAGSICLISGEPGIGKTRLIGEFSVRSQRAGVAIAKAQAGDVEVAPPFWAWIQILRCVEEFGPDARELISRYPSVARLLEATAGPIEPTPEVQRFAVMDASVAFLGELRARCGPYSLVFDDAHRLDSASWDLIDWVGRRARELGILVVAGFREREIRESIERAEKLAELSRVATVFELGGFSPGEAAAFVQLATGGDVPAGDAAMLVQRCGGNPYFLQLLTSSPVGGDSLPATLRDGIARQIAGLPSHVRRLLVEASVLGQSFRLDDLGGISSLRGEGLHDAIAPAHDLGVVRVREGQWSFRHELLRDALYATLLPGQKSVLHARCGEVLARRAASGHFGVLGEVARHFSCSEESGAQMRAVYTSCLAARYASARLAYADAVPHASRAVRLAEHEGVDPRLLCDLVVLEAECSVRAGQRNRADSLVRRAASLAQDTKYAAGLARAALAMSPGFFSLQVGAVDGGLIELLERGVDSADAGSSIECRLRARHAMALYWKEGSRKEREQLLRHATRSVRSEADRLFVAVYEIAGLWDISNRAEREAASRRAIPACEGAGQYELALMARVFLITCLIEGGDVPAAKREIESLRGVVEYRALPQAEVYLRFYDAMLALNEGRFADCDAVLMATEGVGELSSDLNSHHSAGVISITSRLFRRGLEGARPEFDFLISRFPDFAAWRAGLGFVLAHRGEVEEAGELVRGLVAHLPGTDRNLVWLLMAAHTGEAAAELRDRKAARAVRILIEPYAGCIVPVGYGASTWGSVDRVLGRLFAVAEDWERSAAFLRQAIELERANNLVPWHTWSEIELGGVLIASGRSHDRDKGEECLRLGRERAGRIGATMLIKRAEELVRLL